MPHGRVPGALLLKAAVLAACVTGGGLPGVARAADAPVRTLTFDGVIPEH